MSDKTKTKAELLEMLAEAVRNTQPRRSVTRNPSRSATRDPSRSAKRNPANHDPRRSARPKSKAFGHLLAASSGVDNAAGDSMIDKMRKDLAQRQAVKAFLREGKRKAVTEYEKAQEASQKNYERLRAERLIREAAKSKKE